MSEIGAEDLGAPHVEVLSRWLVKYAPPIYGFAGMAVVVAWLSTDMEIGWLLITALVNSGLLAMYGLDAASQGWYDE